MISKKFLYYVKNLPAESLMAIESIWCCFPKWSFRSSTDLNVFPHIMDFLKFASVTILHCIELSWWLDELGVVVGGLVFINLGKIKSISKTSDFILLK